MKAFTIYCTLDCVSFDALNIEAESLEAAIEQARLLLTEDEFKTMDIKAGGL